MAKAKTTAKTVTKPVAKATPTTALAGKTKAAQQAAAVATNTTAQNLSAWEQAKASSKKSRSGTNCNDGNFTARLSAARLVSTDNGQKPVFTLTIYDSAEDDGKTAERWSTPIESDDPQQLDYLARDLRNLGVTNLDDMPAPADWLDQEALDAIVEANPAVHVTVKTSTQDTAYKNVYINKPVLGDEGPAEIVEEVVEEVEEVVAEIGEGSNVSWEQNGQTRTGSIVRFEDNGNKAIVKPDEGGNPVRLAFEKLSLVAPE